MDQELELPKGFVYTPSFLKTQKAYKLFDHLSKTVDWEHEELLMFGKKVTTKRTSAFFGDPELSYTYAGHTKYVTEWTKELLSLKQTVERETGEQFNVCLLNKYEDGTEGMGWHSDNESELGPNPAVASITLGAERRFDIRDKQTGKTWKIILENGSLLFMGDNSQTQYKHQMPVSKKVRKPRINLTFRKIIN